MTTRCARPKRSKTARQCGIHRRDKINAAADRQALSNHPEIARDDIGHPGDVGRKTVRRKSPGSTGTTSSEASTDWTKSSDRIAGVAADAPGFNRHIGLPRRIDELFQRGLFFFQGARRLVRRLRRFLPRLGPRCIEGGVNADRQKVSRTAPAPPVAMPCAAPPGRGRNIPPSKRCGRAALARCSGLVKSMTEQVASRTRRRATLPRN